MSMSDLEQIRDAVYRYARGCDRLDQTLLASCLHPQLEMVVPNLPPMGGPDQAATTVGILTDMFELTQHRISQCHYTVDGDLAEGECYCVAAHLLKERRDGKGVVDEWSIRYQDKLERHDGEWLFMRRELIIDWKEERLVSL
mgnify:FL=1